MAGRRAVAAIAIAKFPLVARDSAVRIVGARPVEATREISAVIGKSSHRRLVRRADGDALAIGVRVALVIGHLQAHGVGAARTVYMAGRRAAAGLAVTKVPLVARDSAVRIVGARPVEATREISAVKGESGHRRLVHHTAADGDALAIGICVALVVGHLQAHGVRAALTVYVAGRRAAAGLAVTKVPLIAHDGAVRIVGARPVEAAREIGAVIGEISHRRLVHHAAADGDALAIGVRVALVIGHLQAHGVRAARTVYVAGRRAAAGVAIAKVPLIAHDGAVGIVGARPVKAAREIGAVIGESSHRRPRVVDHSDLAGLIFGAARPHSFENVRPEAGLGRAVRVAADLGGV